VKISARERMLSSPHGLNFGCRAAGRLSSATAAPAAASGCSRTFATSSPTSRPLRHQITVGRRLALRRATSREDIHLLAMSCSVRSSSAREDETLLMYEFPVHSATYNIIDDPSSHSNRLELDQFHRANGRGSLTRLGLSMAMHRRYSHTGLSPSTEVP